MSRSPEPPSPERRNGLLPALALAGTLLLPLAAGAQTLRENLWVTDGYVAGIAATNEAIYIGGNFTLVGPLTRGGALLDLGSGAPIPPNLDLDGDVVAVAPDANGGWYIGGSFTTVQGQPRNYLAQIDATGNVTSWDPSPNAAVMVLTPAVGTLYVGGVFTAVGAVNRNYVASFDTATGQLTAWNPNADWVVDAIAVDGSTVYVGGGFRQIGSAPRNRIAALDAITGFATIWNPNADSDVHALAVNGSKVYVGGYFANIGGQSRRCLAAIDASSGTATPWNPNPNWVVKSLAIHQLLTFPFTETVYAGGYFTTVGGQARTHIAAIDGMTGLPTSWNANADGDVLSIALKTSFTGSLTAIYAGGAFTSIGGLARNRVASLDPSGAATAWNPNADGWVTCLAVGAGTVFVGGYFTSTGRQPRSGLAALDATTGAATAWNPSVAGRVLALVVDSSRVYAGGDFSSIGGDPSTINLAAIDAATGAVLPGWNADPDGDVYDLALQGGTLFVAGAFNAIGGQSRKYLAAVDPATGAAASWNPSPNSDVFTIAVTERTNFPFTRTVYAGGWFTMIGSQSRTLIAAIDGATGLATSWNPGADLPVFDLLVTTDAFGGAASVYAAGDFSSIGGQSRNYIAELNPAGAATGWNPDADSWVHSLARAGNVIYAGGGFAAIGGQPRSYVAALDMTSGIAGTWNPGLDALVTELFVQGADVYVGGTFQAIDGQPRGCFAGFRDQAPVGIHDPLPLASGLPVHAAPNPFRSDVALRFAMPEPGEVDVDVYDVMGRRVRRLHEGARAAGERQVTWDGRNEAGVPVASGVYLVRVRANDQELRTRVLRVR